MHCTVLEAQGRMDAWEFALWQAWDRVQPWGQWRQDLGFALVCSTLANCHRAPSSIGYTYQDFMPDFTGVRDTADEMVATAKQVTAMLGGSIGDNRKPDC